MTHSPPLLLLLLLAQRRHLANTVKTARTVSIGPRYNAILLHNCFVKEEEE